MRIHAIRHDDVRALSNSLEVIGGLQVVAWLQDGSTTQPSRRLEGNAQDGWMS